MDKALKDLSGKFSDLLAQHQELSDDFESYKETSVQKHDALRAELDELRERVLALKSKDEAVPPTVPFFDKLKLDYPPGPDPTGVAHADKQRYKLNYPDGMLKLAGGPAARQTLPPSTSSSWPSSTTAAGRAACPTIGRLTSSTPSTAVR